MMEYVKPIVQIRRAWGQMTPRLTMVGALRAACSASAKRGSGRRGERRRGEGPTTRSAGEEELEESAGDDGGEFEELKRHECETCEKSSVSFAQEERERVEDGPANMT
jgi:hypothetical protein